TARAILSMNPETKRHLQIDMAEQVAQDSIPGGGPLKGGQQLRGSVGIRGDQDANQETGARALWTLARKGAEPPELPVFPVDAAGPAEGIVIFPTKEKAVLYVQVARWADLYEPKRLTGLEIKALLSQLMEGGVKYMAIDPNRLAQERGEGQGVLAVDEWQDLT